MKRRHATRFGVIVGSAFLFLVQHAACQGYATVTMGMYESHDVGLSQRAFAVATSFTDLLPGIGLFSGNVDGGLDNAAVRRGQSFLSLQQFRLGAGKLDTTFGDFNFSLTSSMSPNDTVFTAADLSVSGFNSVYRVGESTYSFFVGSTYFLDGARMPFRFGSGQLVGGFSAHWHPFSRLQIGVRSIRIGSEHNSRAIALNWMGSYLEQTSTSSLQAEWRLFSHVDLYDEISLSFSRALSSVTLIGSSPFSHQAGVQIKSSKLTLRAASISQAANYLPVNGFYANGRRGLMAEFHFRPSPRLDLSGSGNSFDKVASYVSSASVKTFFLTAGAQSQVRNTTVSATYSLLSSNYFSASQPATIFKNEYATISFGRPWKKTLFRTTLEQIRLAGSSGNQLQRDGEVEEGIHLAKATFGGALKYEFSPSQNQQLSTWSSKYFWNYNWHYLSTFGSFEQDKGLTVSNILVNSSSNSSTLGASVQLPQKWSLQAEAFRTRLLLTSRLEDSFLLLSQGIQPSLLLNANHWIAYLAISHSFSWKGGESQARVVELARGALPQVGSIDGFVSVQYAQQSRPSAADIPLILDGSLSVKTNGSGYFRFNGIGEGPHTLAIDVSKLPVDYDPPPNASLSVDVSPKKASHTGFAVHHLSDLHGTLHPANGAKAENVIVRMSPDDRYTTVNADGDFTFTNAPDGIHTISVDLGSLEADNLIEGVTQKECMVGDSQPCDLQFQLTYTPKKKPVRRITLGATDTL